MKTKETIYLENVAKQMKVIEDCLLDAKERGEKTIKGETIKQKLYEQTKS